MLQAENIFIPSKPKVCWILVISEKTWFWQTIAFLDRIDRTITFSWFQYSLGWFCMICICDIHLKYINLKMWYIISYMCSCREPTWGSQKPIPWHPLIWMDEEVQPPQDSLACIQHVHLIQHFLSKIWSVYFEDFEAQTLMEQWLPSLRSVLSRPSMCWSKITQAIHQHCIVTQTNSIGKYGKL